MRICVFCGARSGNEPAYAAAARQFGALLAQRGIGLVYGGGGIGLMRELADAALAQGGEVIGVIPRFLATAEIAHHGLSELHIVDSMHSRKAAMAELADAFVALPGGIGTLEEWIEVLSWWQLELHTKPCALLDVAGYFNHLLAFLHHATAEGFLATEHLDSIKCYTDPSILLDEMQAVSHSRFSATALV